MLSVTIGGGAATRDNEDIAALGAGEHPNAVIARRLLSEYDGQRLQLDSMGATVRAVIEAWHHRMVLAGALPDEPLPPFGVRYNAAARRIEIFDPTTDRSAV